MSRKARIPTPLAAALVYAVLFAGIADAQPGPPLEGTYWRATELAGKPIPTQESAREPHLVFQLSGRISGADGCNTVTGSYRLKADAVSFSQLAGTQTACLTGSEIERAFRDALRSAARFAVTGNRLELFNASGRRTAAFVGREQAGVGPLAGTSWQLVRFQGGDDTSMVPDDRSKYTIAFGADGQVTARVDCNRGRGTWKLSGVSQVALSPLALTRAQCPAGSMHDQIVKQWTSIRTYLLREGHLFLLLVADGGAYEFEPGR
jgi:heat shock protein HslJ